MWPIDWIEILSDATAIEKIRQYFLMQIDNIKMFHAQNLFKKCLKKKLSDCFIIQSKESRIFSSRFLLSCY